MQSSGIRGPYNRDRYCSPAPAFVHAHRRQTDMFLGSPTSSKLPRVQGDWTSRRDTPAQRHWSDPEFSGRGLL